MSIFDLFRKQRSAPMARERLQVLLAHERASAGSDLAALRSVTERIESQGAGGLIGGQKLPDYDPK